MEKDAIIAIVAAFGVLITTIGAVVVNIIVATRTNRRVEEVSDKADEISAQAKVITGHVNSAATASVAKISALEEKILALQQQVALGDKRAAVLAQSKADTAVVVATLAEKE